MASVKSLSEYWLRIQSNLFPWLEEELGELTEKEQKLVATLELVRVERFTAFSRSLRGRPPKERAAVARAFVARAVYNMPTTRALLDRLVSDKKLRRICGWEQKGEIPSESTFSRVFAEFSESQLPVFVHQTMITENLSDDIVLQPKDAMRQRLRHGKSQIKKQKPRPNPARKSLSANRGVPGRGRNR